MQAFCFSTHVAMELFPSIKGTLSLSTSASLFAPRPAVGGRQGLPATLSLDYSRDKCSDFPHQFCPPKVVAKLSVSSRSRDYPSIILGTFNFVFTFSEQNWRNYPTQSPTIILLLSNNWQVYFTHPRRTS